ncbi:Gfo/Idh/MocA family oxidoreductase [Azospirillum sp.]|uniref:Gfo/Idh/MocA family protein n=1 Tax=Azospirillum sp. TaxID=34012 RepID=UPI002D2FFB24|nr:Gfo/Idh/MocA family oxidoreductase [Azospirillum sp.]HYD70502.1 Gfo/Idh/MocA family oxidoreductase [Azospirillum sp.]
MTVVGQIGCGYWGPNLLRNLSAQPDCRVKWVADASEARRQFVGQNFPRTEATPDWRTVLDDPEVEAVVIATPASTHFELARNALFAGKHALVEKPLAMTRTEAEDLRRLAAETGRVLMVGHTFLYNSAVHYMKKLVDDGALGDLFYIYGQRLNLGQVRTDVNAWWNLAPHDVSILLHLMNGEMPVRVAAQGAAFIQKGIEDVVFATLTWKSGIVGHVHVSWLDPGKVRRFTVVGSRKMVIYDDVNDDKIAIYDKGVDRVPRIGERMDFDDPRTFQFLHRAGDILLPRVKLVEPLKAEVEHFLDCVRRGATPITGPDHAVAVVTVMAAVQTALKTGQVQTIEPMTA